MAAADVFVDTAGFLALWDAGDEHHGRAVELQEELARRNRRFLTTEYVVDETVTLLLVRHSHAAAADFLQTIEKSEALRLEWIDPDAVSCGEWLVSESTPTSTGRSRTASASSSCANCVCAMRSPPTITFGEAGFTPLLKT